MTETKQKHNYQRINMAYAIPVHFLRSNIFI